MKIFRGHRFEPAGPSAPHHEQTGAKDAVDHGPEAAVDQDGKTEIKNQSYDQLDCLNNLQQTDPLHDD